MVSSGTMNNTGSQKSWKNIAAGGMSCASLV